MFIGSLYDLALQSHEDAIIGFDHLQIHSHVLLYTGLVESAQEPFSVLGLGNAPEGIREIVLASGVLDMAEEFCPLSHQVVASSEKISCGPHFGWIDVGLSKHATP